MTQGPVWQALPMAALVLDANDRIEEVNGPAEGLFNRSARSLTGAVLTELTEIDGDLSTVTARVRRTLAPMTLHDARLSIGRAPES